MSLYDLEIAQWKQLLSAEPSYRADQIWQAIHKHAIRPEHLTSIPKQLRDSIAKTADLAPALSLVNLYTDDNELTEKALFKLDDKRVLETVLMHYSDRSTVCISSQAGCAMGCKFCATGQQGFYRHLTTGEIVEQVAWAISRTRTKRGSRRLSNVVFMGMGEPLANTKNLFKALQRINVDIGIGARHITVSTVGIIPGIQRFGKLNQQYNLAISLHAANNEKRTSLVPITRTYPLEALLEVLADYRRTTNRRISFEWAMMDGINDSDQDARELIAICVPLQAHVNLIPLNPTPKWPGSGSPMARVRSFSRILEMAGIVTSIRDNRGTKIAAACGQLAETHVTLGGDEGLFAAGSAKMDLSGLLD